MLEEEASTLIGRLGAGSGATLVGEKVFGG